MILRPHRSATVGSRLRVALSAVSFTLVTALALAPASAQQVSEAAKKQMADVLAFKRSLTPAEQKMSTRLVLASRVAQHQPLGPLARFVPSNVAAKQLIEIKGSLSPSLMTSKVMSEVKTVNGTVPQSSFNAGRVQATVTPAQLLELASHPDVTSLREVTGAHTNVGSITSQGYIAHRANQAVTSGINGAGINVGVLSDSASAARVAALISTGDLPANVVVLPGEAGTGEDEGTAMMEIVHDLAPGANLFFATAFNGEQSMADNIRTLRYTYHCDIIVDDISYFDEPVFQDGLIAQAVNDITADGGLYFSSAANSGNFFSGTSGTWEGDFKSSGVDFFGDTLHNFGTTAAPQPYDVLTSVANSGVWLHWSDAQGKAADDYDLFILDSTGSYLKAFSADTQNGTQDPLEYVYPDQSCGTANPTGYCPAAGDLILVGLFNGARRALHIDTERATVSIGTSGATFGHNAGSNTFTMAATYWNSARIGITPFTGHANPVEVFSSDGPRKIFYKPDGTPITPGNYLFSTRGGITYQKPEATAADGVFTRTPGFLPFFGTSAAAPHAAAIAALVKSANPKLTNLQIRGILTKTALDNMLPGPDPDGGYGVLTAPAAVQAGQAIH